MPKVCPICGAIFTDSTAFCPADGTTLRAADVEGDLIGNVIADRYLITDLLGEGGMGKVYLARHVRLPQQAAIKVMRPDQLRDAAAVARFNREAASASRIDHDRVARVYDFGETPDGTVYLAMEYVHGRTLARILRDDGPLDPRRAASIVRQIADGLDAAHRMGIVHRDLKPDNVMLIEDPDGTDRVKVVDFGIAKAFGIDERSALTQVGFVVGTPEFMSPEQLLGGAVDGRSDVYALALVAYQCLTGGLPFDIATPDHGMVARLVTSPRPLLEVSPDVPWPSGVQTVFDGALARDPEQRPATAGAFARALVEAMRQWLGEGAGLPRPTPPLGSDALSSPPIETPAPAAEAAGSAAAAKVATAAAGPRAHPSSAPAVRKGTGTRVALSLVVLATIGGGAAMLLQRGDAAAPPGAAAPTPAPPTVDPAAATPQPVEIPRQSVPAPAPPAASARTIAPSTARRPAPARPVPQRPPAAVVPPDGARPTTSMADRQTLDSLRGALTSADEGSARRASAALTALLPRLRTAADSTWAQLTLAEARGLSGDHAGACAALRGARATARSSAQRGAVSHYDEKLGC